MRIVTLTLSPAFDVHCSVPGFAAERENLVAAYTRGIGGKGINISRALLENGTPNLALVVLGDENAADFVRGMDACGISERAEILIKGRIRENFTIHPDTGDETRLSFKGFTADASLLDLAFDKISPDADTLVTFTGSLPGGISAGAAEAFLASLANAGARVVIDSKSIPLDMMRRLKPWLIKPNAEEIAAYIGETDTAGLIAAARELHAGGIENALISLGADGAVLACSEGTFLAKPPRINALSTIGAGDSMIAGFIAADGNAAERLRLASAWGTAACLTEGTNPPKPADIAEIYKNVIITEV